jgi:hypothetical protein
MLGRPGFSGSTPWMNWLRRPRLKSAVHSVAVLTFISSARVAGVMGISSVQKMSGSGTALPKVVSRKSKSQPSSACRMCRPNIQP